MYPTRRISIRYPKMFRFSGIYIEQSYNILSCKRSKIGTFLNAGDAAGVSKGGAFARSAPLADFFWSFSCSATRKGHYRTIMPAKRYTFWFYNIFPERYMRKKKRYCFVLFTNSLYISLQLCYNTLNWFYIAIS